MSSPGRSRAAFVLALSAWLGACSFDEGATDPVRPDPGDPHMAGEGDAQAGSDAQAPSDAQAASDAHAASDASTASDARAPGDRLAVSGELTGLAGDRVVLDVGGQVVDIARDGSFSTEAVFDDGELVAASVLVAPRQPRQQCAVQPESVVAGDDADALVVSCGPLALPVAGVVSGLLGDGLVVALNGVESLPIAADGAFAFSSALADEQPFEVEVAEQPSAPSQVCLVLGGTGVAGGDGVEVDVRCGTEVRDVGGTVTGLHGDGLVLSLNGQLLAVAASGSFSFEVPDGTVYALEVAAQPTAPLETCAVTSGASGTATADVATIVVACEPRAFNVRGFARGTAAGMQLSLDGSELLAVDDGPFVFSATRADGASYAVSVATPPPGKQCSIVGAAGTIDGADALLDVLCVDTLQLVATTSGVQVLLAWNDVGAEYDLFYVVDDALDPLSGTRVADVTSGHALARTLGVTYVFVVRARLADGHAIVSAPATVDGDFFREGFEGAVFPPPGFSTRAFAFNGAGDTRWELTTLRPDTGTRAARHLFGGSAAGNQNGWLITPLLPLGDSPVLRFFESVDFSVFYAGHFVLVCSATADDCTSPPTNFSQVVEVGSPAEDTYVERTVNLAAYAGEDVYLVFRYTGVFADTWYIDDIEIDLR